MKLLLINYEFPPLGGGAGNATQNIAKELVRQGHTVLVLSTWFSGLKEKEVIDGYEILRIHSRRKRVDRSNPFEMLHFIWCTVRESRGVVEKFSPDATISFFAVPSGLIAYWFKKKLKIPYVLSLRGGDVPGFLPKNLKYWHILSSPLTAIVWRNADAIVANSVGLKELAEKTARKFGKIVDYIPNGVDTGLFSPGPRKENDIFKILFVGRLIEQKGVKYLLQAVNELVIKDSLLRNKLSCDIIGDGPLRGELERLSHSLSLGGIVNFHGWISRGALPKFYREASVFVLPSFDEGMPNVILEAMASGLPIIATDISGNNELVENNINGFLYKHQTELTQALSKLMDDVRLREKMGQAAYEKSKKYDWSSVTVSYLKLI